jgi:hypothetical protein
MARIDSGEPTGGSFAARGPALVLAWRRAPFPFASHPVETGDVALDHFVPPLIARYDEGGEIADAKAKGAERHQNESLQR